MLPIPNRIWVAQRQYERCDGIEHVEAVLHHEGMVDIYREEGYEIKEFLSADYLRGLAR